MNGNRINCARCAGHGLVTVWSFGVKEPDECADCGGSGFNWRYSGGAVARYYGGPLIGRDSDGTRSAETACPAPVPQDCQARAEGIAQTPGDPIQYRGEM